MEPSRPLVLVLGGSGQIGSAVLANLARTSISTRAMSRDPATLSTASENLQVVRGDYGDSEDLAAALQGVDTLLMIGKFEPRLAEFQIAIVHAAKKAGVRHIVQSSGVFADPASPAIVQRWLGQVEQAVRESGLLWTIMRPSFFMQNFLPQAKRVADEGVLTALVADSHITPIDTRDIAAVYAAVLASKGHEGQVYELTGSEQMTHSEVAAHMSTVLGKPVRFAAVDAEQARANMLKSGAAPIMAEAAIDGQRFRLSGSVPPLTDTVKRLLGRAPILLDQFLRDHLARFQPATQAAESVAA